jgi:hypothetical protein
VHQSHGKRWAALPAKPQLDTGGRQRLGDNGKPAWLPFGKWRDERLREAFSQRVCELVCRAHPHAFED